MFDETIERQASSAPRSVDKVARTFVAVIATDTPVEGVRLNLDGLVIPDDTPVQLDHDTKVEKSVGRVQRTWREGPALLAEIRITEDKSLDWLLARLADGTVKGVSIGFRVTQWGPRDGDNRVAAKAELIELSITNFPADTAAIIRSDKVDNKDNAAVQTAEETDVLSAEEIKRQAKEFRRMCRESGIRDDDFADDIISDFAVGAINEDEACRLILKRVTDRTRVNASLRSEHNDTTMDNPDVRVRAMGEAIFTRATPGHEPSPEARQFVGYTILDIARECLKQTSALTRTMSPTQTIERAAHTTSDFPLILGDSVGRTLRGAYQAAPSGLKMVGRRTTARDFRDKHRLQISEAPQLEKVNEAGEFKQGTMEEAQATYRLATFGRIIGITRQALVNDDVGAFTDLARRMGQAALATEAKMLVDLLEGDAGVGPIMNDGLALFHADHNNLAASVADPDVSGLSTAREAMRAQVGLTGELISITPRYLIVPPALETIAEQALADVTPAKAGDFNPFSGTLQLVVEPRLADPARWYVAAAPSEIDGLEFAYLEGEEGPQIETRSGFEVDGVQIKVRLDFGAGFVDHRSWFQANGS